MRRLIDEPAGTGDLVAAVGVRTRQRLRALIRRLRGLGHTDVAALAEDALGSRGKAEEWPFRGDVRAVIASCEQAIVILQLADRVNRADIIAGRTERARSRLAALLSPEKPA